MKTTILIIASILAVFAQVYFLGLNGLTLLTIPMTIYLGAEVLERINPSTETPNKQ